LRHGQAIQQRPEHFRQECFCNLLDKLDPEAAAERTPEPEAKDPKKQAAGRMGGVKGGKVRALRLSVKQRKDIAKKAAKSRWNKTEDSE
jgi:hypothetical protein